MQSKVIIDTSNTVQDVKSEICSSDSQSHMWCRIVLTSLSSVCRVTFQVFPLAVMPVKTGCSPNADYF